MKRWYYALVFIAVILLVFFAFHVKAKNSYCLIGAFIADKPIKEKISEFKDSYGKKPYLVMVFTDWEKYPDDDIIRQIYDAGSVLFMTWEPWYAAEKKPIDYDGLLSGKYDEYIASFANRLKFIPGKVFLRFAHEANGDWYPWSAKLLGKDKFIAVTKYVRKFFNKIEAANIEWVFSINWEDLPADNSYLEYYPGEGFVDYIGIDGYNWGNTKSWSKWMSFKEIFGKRYNQAIKKFNKPIIISEFGSTARGGDKRIWIKEAFRDIKGMNRVKAFILFNIDKEADWNFSASSAAGKELKLQLDDNYFREDSCPPSLAIRLALRLAILLDKSK